MQSGSKKMQSAQNTHLDQPDTQNAPEGATPTAHIPAQRSGPNEAPLLGEEQIIKLQKILRSMDHKQLQTVLAAVQPNVLRLCLHEIFGAPATSPKTEDASPSPPAPGLSLHTRRFAKGHASSSVMISEPGQSSSGSSGSLRRMSPRRYTQKNAKIYCPNSKANVDCLILDISKTGALVFLDHSGDLPDTFALYDIGDLRADEEFVHLPHKNCRVVWRKRNKLGVAFEN